MRQQAVAVSFLLCVVVDQRVRPETDECDVAYKHEDNQHSGTQRSGIGKHADNHRAACSAHDCRTQDAGKRTVVLRCRIQRQREHDGVHHGNAETDGREGNDGCFLASEECGEQ